uniref:ATP-dependent protease La Type I n=1 Tax=uncultured bacterium AZ_379 TaxID=1630015 RepID=A0A0E3M0B9_9BACT|nr:ATP-dependent protease La Type I [uncultured bacterium AZ_379]
MVPITVALHAGSGGVDVIGSDDRAVREATQVAFSWLRTRAPDLGISTRAFAGADVRVRAALHGGARHGTSLGLAILLAMISAFSGRAVPEGTCAVGEITLRGVVLRVEAICEMLLAAHRAGVRAVLVPKFNHPDLEALSPTVRYAMDIETVSRMDEAVAAAFGGGL